MSTRRVDCLRIFGDIFVHMATLPTVTLNAIKKITQQVLFGKNLFVKVLRNLIFFVYNTFFK